MKKLSFLEKILFFLNSIIATVLLLSYLLPFISPKTVPLFAILSLFVPFLIIMNIIFVVYWLIKLKKQFFLSIIILITGWVFSSPFYKLSSKNSSLNNDLKVMSYNVRTFNYFKWNKDKKLDQKEIDLINEENPDVLAIQEFYNSDKINFTYPYKYIKTKSKKNKFGMAIYSRFKIINKGSLDLKNSTNNIIFVDILKENDTIRIYNLHLESLKINTQKENFGEKDSGKLIARLGRSFKKQALQTEQFIAHEKQWKGKKIICGDFNNTAYSWVYHKISKNKKDAFIEAGKGFGKTYNYWFPMRIDFILTDETAIINKFSTFSEKYSDHFPIQSKINW
ncbi:endonuclease/exonuclease/phosphatase family protein [Polaribacter sp. MSW13]|uniref:Endonuclease/exonuclease/phosphatase family protein n=1 Tax=Polaribacter marinus TaxID=2916838 RepID=A0A9X1VL09_9FLAO|nr:endonuclease/exonuclease/phosphatase family protein [Polaribacter marinus]MCI2227990.1 endonuclease/exonuclease/phosphatase family protein [Polaribacter marinus]